MPPTPIAPCWPTTQRLQAAWAVIKGDVVSNESSLHNFGVNSPPSPYAGDESSCHPATRLGAWNFDPPRRQSCRPAWWWGECSAWHLPQDLAAEQSALSGMLLSKDAIADVLERLRRRCEPKLRTIGRTYGHFRLTQTDTVDDIRSFV
jgi:hypothetical protein